MLTSKEQRYLETYKLLLYKSPPNKYLCNPDDLDDDDYLDLRDFCAEHSVIDWMTGISILEAAQHIVDTAIENRNLNVNGEYTRDFICTWKYRGGC